MGYRQHAIRQQHGIECLVFCVGHAGVRRSAPVMGLPFSWIIFRRVMVVPKWTAITAKQLQPPVQCAYRICGCSIQTGEEKKIDDEYSPWHYFGYMHIIHV